MNALDPQLKRRLVSICRLFESDKAGERQAALEAARRVLPVGVTIADLLDIAIVPLPGSSAGVEPVPAGPAAPEWKLKALAILRMAGLLTDKEARFTRNMARARFAPTEAQQQWLNDIAEKLAVVV